MATDLVKAEIGIEQQTLSDVAAGLIDQIGERRVLREQTTLQGLGVQADVAGHVVEPDRSSGQDLADQAAHQLLVAGLDSPMTWAR